MTEVILGIMGMPCLPRSRTGQMGACTDGKKELQLAQAKQSQASSRDTSELKLLHSVVRSSKQVHGETGSCQLNSDR